MKLSFVLILVSVSLFGQSRNEIQNQIKFKNYSHLDSIDVYSKDYPTKLVEGSGFIKNKKNKNIGSIGYSIQITKDKSNKIIRILKSQSDHYEKYHKNAQKSVISEISIYFDDFQQPDLAKYISKTLISDSLIKTETRLFDLKENNNDIPGFKSVKDLLETIKK